MSRHRLPGLIFRQELRVDDTLHFESTGEQELKGLSAPVAVFALVD